jgi:DNA-binding transcriptional ArsR family regulator
LSTTVQEDPRLILYNYWKDVQPIKELEGGQEYQLGEQEIRKGILKILREGVKEQYGEYEQRHVFNAQELLAFINEERGDEDQMKLTNMHYHLEKLMQANMITVVTKIQEGKHRVRYYGRTAKLFLFNDAREISDFKKNILTKFSLLALEVNPDLVQEEVHEMLEEILQRSGKIKDQIKLWIEKHHEPIGKLDIDVLTLFEIFMNLSCQDPELNNLYTKMADIYQIRS